jgi:hypothetical protein
MNIFTDMLFLSIYLFVMLYFQLPDVNLNDNYLMHKIILFVDAFCFYYAIQLIKKIKNKCKINPYEILQQSIMMGLYVAIGYSVFVDLLHMSWSQPYTGDIAMYGVNKKYFTIITVIVTLVTMIQMIGTLFIKSCDTCDVAKNLLLV